MSGMTTRRPFAAALAALAALSLAACQPSAPPPSDIGGAFQLVNQDGRPVDQSILNGKWSAVFFGFTYCPDFCPTTLQALKAAEAELGPREAEKLQVVFISVDPERDTPDQLKTYVEDEAFPEDVIGLTGTPAQVDAAAKAFRAFYRKNGTRDDYLVDHTSVVYLMDPQGRFVRPLGGGMTPEQMAGQIRDAMRGRA